jgi:hypothetical protein
MAAQVVKVAASPAQRWVLYQMAHAQTEKVKGGEGSRVYRRFLQAFGLSHVGRVLRQHAAVSAKQATDESALAVFELTAENVDYAHKLLDGELQPLAVDVLDELIDRLEDAHAGRPGLPPEGVPEFDSSVDALSWVPEPPAA